MILTTKGYYRIRLKTKGQSGSSYIVSYKTREEAEARLNEHMGSFYVNDFHSGREECGDGWVLGECSDVLEDD